MLVKMVGFRYRIKDLPEESDEPKILITRLFLPIGIIFLTFGAWAGWKYFGVTAPPDSQLHEIRLRDMAKVTGGNDPKRAVQTIYLHSGSGDVEYKSPWPRFEQVRGLDTNLSLLVDSTNLVWALKSRDGVISERKYFLSRNLEIKTIYGFCALFFLPSGLLGLAAFGSAERELRNGTFPDNLRILLPARKLILVSALFGYLFIFGLVLMPLLEKILPFWSLGFFWVLSAGVIGNLLVNRLKKWRPRSGAFSEPIQKI
jgi:hypothetical protein